MNKYKVVILMLIMLGSLRAQMTWTQATASANWSARYQHTTLVYDNKMWVMGGAGPINDVWYSTDGVSWTQATGSAGWVGRYGQTGVVYDNKVRMLRVTCRGPAMITNG